MRDDPPGMEFNCVRAGLENGELQECDETEEEDRSAGGS